MGIHHWEFPSGNIFTKGIWSGQGQENGGQFPMNDLGRRSHPLLMWWQASQKTGDLWGGTSLSKWTFAGLAFSALTVEIALLRADLCGQGQGFLFAHVPPYSSLRFWRPVTWKVPLGSQRTLWVELRGGLRGYSKSLRICEPNYKSYLAIWLLVRNFSSWKIK